MMAASSATGRSEVPAQTMTIVPRTSGVGIGVLEEDEHTGASVVDGVGQGSQDHIGLRRGQASHHTRLLRGMKPLKDCDDVLRLLALAEDNLGVTGPRQTPRIDHRHVQFVDPGGVHQCKRGIDVEVACTHGSQKIADVFPFHGR